MRTAIYVRVSTTEQSEEGYSIAAQKYKLQSYCESQGWSIVGFYVDEGISAKDMNRPELKRMMGHIEMGAIDVVLVYKLDRLTRSVLDLYKLLELFDKYNCKFKSSTEVYDTTTAMGKLFITIVAALAQWERSNIGERVRFGLEEKVRQGKYAAHRKPFGYSLDNSNGELTIIPEEAKIVKRIFSNYLEGHSTNKIANDLLGTPGAKWSHMQIYKILKNPLYKGTLRWGEKSNNYFEVDNAVPPIINEEIFERAQFQLKNRGLQHPRSAASDYVFSSKVKCGLCGNLIVGNKTKAKGREYKSYRCSGRKLKLCNLNISSLELENLFLQHLSALKWNQVTNKVNTTIDEPVDETEELEQELKIIAKRRKKWNYSWANSIINDQEYTELMKEETEKEKVIQQKLQKVVPTKSHSKEDIQELLSNIKESWNVLNDYEKKTLVNIIIDSFIITREGIRGQYKFTISDISFN